VGIKGKGLGKTPKRSASEARDRPRRYAPGREQVFAHADDLGQFAERVIRLQAAHEPIAYRLRRRCAWRHCGWALDVRSRSGIFGHFCPVHAAELAAIRAELEQPRQPAARRGRRPKALAQHLAEVDERLGEAA
jgi:hypothetical protein